MMHPDEGALQALLDDELAPAERAALERHLAGCAACGGELAALRSARAALAGALARLDRPPPSEWARQRVQQRAGRRPAGVRGAVVLRRAALLVLGSAAVLSATVPGSPVRAWLFGAPERAELARARAGDAEPTSLPAAAPAAPAGVSLRPAGGRVRVVLTAPAPGIRVRMRLHDGERLGVWAAGAAATARFRTAADRVEVAGAGPGELRIEVPRAAQRFVLEVDGRVYLVKEGEQLRFAGPVADTAGPEIVFEVRP